MRTSSIEMPPEYWLRTFISKRLHIWLLRYL